MCCTITLRGEANSRYGNKARHKEKGKLICNIAMAGTEVGAII